MSAAALLVRLEGVRQTGSGRWLARCPAHDDQHPSLSIRELDNGRVLIHDFAGCSPHDVLNAIGLPFSALFPDGARGQRLPHERRPFAAHDVLRCVAHHALVCAIAASDAVAGRLSGVDAERAMQAAGLILDALDTVKN